MRAIVRAVGHAIPERIEDNASLEAELNLERGWILPRTGIERRPIASPDQATSDLAVEAGEHLLRSGNVDRSSIGCLILATSTPDHPLPATAPLVAHRLGLSAPGAFDLAAACSGSVYALRVADALVRAHGTPTLLIAANVLSRRVRADDGAMRPLYADGAGALLLEPHDGERGVIATFWKADGEAYHHIHIPAGGSRQPLTADLIDRGQQFMRFSDNRAVFRYAVEANVSVAKKVLGQTPYEVSDVDWWVPHQANARIIREAGKRLGVPEAKTAMTIRELGNSSAATIPLALSVLSERGQLTQGQLVLLTAVGAGMASGGAVLRW